MLAYQTVNSSTCPNINAELLLVYRLAYTINIILCPLVVVLKIYEGVWQNLTCLKRALTNERKAQHIVEQTTGTQSWPGHSAGLRPWFYVNGLGTAPAQVILFRLSSV